MISIDMVLVTYNPNEKLLDKCIKSIRKGVKNIYIVDNGSNSFELDQDIDNIKLIKLEENMGIAYAQNIGIKEAMKNNVDYILLSDQDTIYPPKYIKNMLNDKYLSIDNSIATIPLFKDNIAINNIGFYKKGLLAHKLFKPSRGLIEVSQAIASGMILNTTYIEDIGLMNEKLFIDWVDFEWCWKAQSKGYKIMGNADIIISHQLGDSSINIGFRKVNTRSYIRHYYITRNAFYLALYSEDLNMLHRITLFFKSFKYIVGYPILAKPHMINFKYVMLGLWHGVTKKLGKLN